MAGGMPHCLIGMVSGLVGANRLGGMDGTVGGLSLLKNQANLAENPNQAKGPRVPVMEKDTGYG